MQKVIRVKRDKKVTLKHKVIKVKKERLVLVKKVKRVKQVQMVRMVIKDKKEKTILQKDRKVNLVLVKKVRRVKREQMVVEQLLRYLIMHQVQQLQVIYGGQVMISICTYIMVMVTQINGFQLHPMLL